MFLYRPFMNGRVYYFILFFFFREVGDNICIFVPVNRYKFMNEEWNKAGNNEHPITPAAFYQFVRIFLLSIGVAFAVSGIIFFFAYNWTDLNKFVKLGVILALIVGAIGALPFLKAGPTVKNIILTGAAMLVGVLFAVFGQIYQTGATAYDLFLGWTLFITLWVIVSDFPPLWLLLLILVDTAVILYLAQNGVSDGRLSCLLVFGINALTLVILNLLLKVKYISVLPDWFSWIVGVSALSYLMTFVIWNILSKEYTLNTLVFTAVVCGLVGWYCEIKQDLFYLILVLLCVLLVCGTLLFRWLELSDAVVMLFILTVFTIGSVTGLIRFIVYVQKRWKNGK